MRSGTDASLPPRCSSATAASWSSPAKTSTASGSRASSASSATAPRAARSSRGGVRALVGCGVRWRKGIRWRSRVDGPRGPARVAQPGAVWLAGATGHPILPFHIEADRSWTAQSWDRHQVPKPGATICRGHRRADLRSAQADEDDASKPGALSSSVRSARSRRAGRQRY